MSNHQMPNQTNINWTEYKARSHKIGPNRYIGVVDRIREVDLGAGFTKIEHEELIIVYRRNKRIPNVLLPLKCDKQARRKAIAELKKLKKEDE